LAIGLTHFDLLATLDLVAQAPAGPDEVVGKQVAGAIARMDALLLGRKTYEIFASYWPHQEDGVDSEIRRCTQQTESRVGRLVAARIRCCDIRTRIRHRHENVHVICSINFVQTLLSERLFGRLNLFLYPIVLGSGKKVSEARRCGRI
jgi:dihydrofolate reductase